MEFLWSPWRYRYIKEGPGSDCCVFCNIAASDDDDSNLVVFRGVTNFVVLNRYPYTSGHAMVIPAAHYGTLEETPVKTLEENMRLVQRLERAIRRAYSAEGINIGINVGRAAGAGVAGHIHTHVLPRWVADSNFMTVTAETRILPEELSDTLAKLRAEFEAAE